MTAMLLPKSTLALQTRMRRDIDNVLDRTSAAPGMRKQVDNFKKRYSSARHRDVGPCGTYNCHGLTFAARRTAISSSSEISKILDDDDYEEISLSDACAGDVALYFVDGDVEHSGIVVEVTDLGPFILSKWGGAQEVVHALGDCPYSAEDVKFFRVCK